MVSLGALRNRPLRAIALSLPYKMAGSTRIDVSKGRNTPLRESIRSAFVLAMSNAQPPAIRCLSCKDLIAAEREGYRIEVACKACGRSRLVEVTPLIRLASIRRWGTDFIEIGSRLRCQPCGAKFPIVRATVEEADGGRSIGPATEAEFLRMVRDQRQ